jgi:hypothetical protein
LIKVQKFLLFLAESFRLLSKFFKRKEFSMLNDTALQAFSSPQAAGWQASLRQGNYWYCLLLREEWPALLQQLFEIFPDRPLLVRFRQLRILELLLKSADFSRSTPRYFPVLLSDYLSPFWSAASSAPPIPEAFYRQQTLWWRWLELYECLPAALRAEQAVFFGIQESDPSRQALAKTHLDAWQALLQQRDTALSLWRRLFPQEEKTLSVLQSRLQAAKIFLAAREQYPTLDFWHSAWQNEGVAETLRELARYQDLRRDYKAVIKPEGWQENADYVFRFYRYLKQKGRYFWQEQRAKRLLKKIAVTMPQSDQEILQLMGHVIRAQQSLQILKKHQALAETLFKEFWQGSESQLPTLQAIVQQQKIFQESQKNQDSFFSHQKLWQADVANPITSVLLTLATQQAQDFLNALQYHVRQFKQILRWQLKNHAYNPAGDHLSPDYWPLRIQEQVSCDLASAWDYLPLWQEWQSLEQALAAAGQPAPQGEDAQAWAKTLRIWAAREGFMERYRDVGIPMSYQRWQNLQQAPLLLLWPEEDAAENWLPPLPKSYVLYIESGEQSDFIVMGLPKLFRVDLERLSAWRLQTPLPRVPVTQNLFLPLEITAMQLNDDAAATGAFEEMPPTGSEGNPALLPIVEASPPAIKLPKRASPAAKKNRSSSKKINRQISAPDYVQATVTLPTAARFQDYPIDLLAEKIKIILQIEAPVHEDILVKRLRQAAGLSRCGSAVIAQIGQALLWLEERQAVKRKGDFFYLPEQRRSNIPLRNRLHLDKNERNLEWISEEELRLAWKSTSGTHELRLVSALQCLGFRQANGKLKQQLSERLRLEHAAAPSVHTTPPPP